MTAYGASRLLTPVANYLGHSLNETNFLAAQFTALILAFVYRKYFSPCNTSVTSRHVIQAAIGAAMGCFCFGSHMAHLFLQAGGCYALIVLAPASMFHILVLAYAIVYLSALHIYHMYYYYGDTSFGITSPVMMLTLKLISLAFSIHDGMHKKPEALKYDQKKYAVRYVPAPLEFLSYVLAFQGLLSGPICFFNDYVAFIEGTNIPNIKSISSDKLSKIPERERKELCPEYAVIRKLGWVFLVLAIAMCLSPKYPKMLNTELVFIETTSFTQRIIYLMVTIFFVKQQYYFAWMISDVAYNASGMGFNGFDDEGRQKWDLVQNVNITRVELSTSLKEIIQSWNIQTSVWLKSVCYERVPVYKTLITYCLSAVWHGFYPGYFLAAFTAVLATMAGRKIRRTIRPLFITSTQMKMVYDVITWFGTQLTAAYVIMPMHALKFWPALHFYHTSMHWCLHIVMILILVVLPNKSLQQNKGSHAVD